MAIEQVAKEHISHNTIIPIRSLELSRNPKTAKPTDNEYAVFHLLQTFCD